MFESKRAPLLSKRELIPVLSFSTNVFSVTKKVANLSKFNCIWPNSSSLKVSIRAYTYTVWYLLYYINKLQKPHRVIVHQRHASHSALDLSGAWCTVKLSQVTSKNFQSFTKRPLGLTVKDSKGGTHLTL